MFLLPNLHNFQILNQENNTVLFIEGVKTVKKSFDKAKFEIYQILAMQGNAEAQCSLAVYGWKGILMLICRLVGNIIWKKLNRKRMLKNN